MGVVRHVPAFLRAHAHLLGAARTEEDLPDPSAAQPPCDDAQDEIDDEEVCEQSHHNSWHGLPQAAVAPLACKPEGKHSPV